MSGLFTVYLGGRCPSAHTGADEGAILYPTFPCRNKKRGAPGCRPNGIFLLPRWASRSPPHQSPSVTASPQGEASGSCNPTQKKRPKSGHIHGLRNRRNIASLRPTTPKPASGNERAIKTGGPGGLPPALFLPISREKWGPRRAGGPPGRCAPRLVTAPTTDRVRSIARPPSPSRVAVKRDRKRSIV